MDLGPSPIGVGGLASSLQTNFAGLKLQETCCQLAIGQQAENRIKTPLPDPAWR